MSRDDRSLIEFGYYREGIQRFEYFVVGVSCALCAYVGQTLRPEKLTLHSAYTLEVVSLLLLVLSTILGFKRIESLVQASRLNAQLLDATEKRGALIAAKPNAQGVIVNEVSGDAYDSQAAAKWKRELTAKINGLGVLIEKERKIAAPPLQMA